MIKCPRCDSESCWEPVNAVDVDTSKCNSCDTVFKFIERITYDLVEVLEQ